MQNQKNNTNESIYKTQTDSHRRQTKASCLVAPGKIFLYWNNNMEARSQDVDASAYMSEHAYAHVRGRSVWRDARVGSL